MRIIKLILLSIPIFLLSSCKDVDDSTFQRHPIHLVSDFEPRKGEPGTIVTIEGGSFSSDASKNHVKFAGADADLISASTSELVVKVPEDATTGIITVIVNGYPVHTHTEFIVE